MAGLFLKSERLGCFLAGSVTVALPLIPAAGCGLARDLERCQVQSRSLEYAAETKSDSLLGTGFLELSETRGAESGAWVVWHLRIAPSVGRARVVSLRQGPPEAPGRVLYEFPLLNSVSESGVITQVFVRTAYAGEVPSAELWELIQRHPVSFEVVFDGDVRPLRVGPLLRTGFSDWQEAFCS
jgi:hypothetical protein